MVEEIKEKNGTSNKQTVLLCIIFMHMFYHVMKGIYLFAANLLSYIPTKYY